MQSQPWCDWGIKKSALTDLSKNFSLQYEIMLNHTGAIAATSIDYGFFMLGPDWDEIEETVRAKKAYAERERWRSILHMDEGAVCPQLRQVEHCDIVQCDV